MNSLIIFYFVLCCILIHKTYGLNVKLYGLSYNARSNDHCRNQEQIKHDLNRIHTLTNRIRLYSIDECKQGPIVLRVAKKLEMKVWLGIWVAADDKIFQREYQQLQSMINQGLINNTVIGIHVGSEAIYRKDITADKAIEYMKKVKTLLVSNEISIPVSIADIVDVFLKNPKLIDAVDIVSANQFSFWERTHVMHATSQVIKRFRPLHDLVKSRGKTFLVSETGWSSGGRHENASEASPENQVNYFKQFYAFATKNEWQYYYFYPFDNPYVDKNNVEAHFGIMSRDGVLKPKFQSLNITQEDIEQAPSFLDIDQDEGKKDEERKDEDKKDEGKKNEDKKDEGKKDEDKKDDGKKDEEKKDEGKNDEGKKDEDKKDDGKKDDEKKDEGKKDEDKKDDGKKDEEKKDEGKKDEGKKEEDKKDEEKKDEGKKDEDKKDEEKKDEEKEEGKKDKDKVTLEKVENDKDNSSTKNGGKDRNDESHGSSVSMNIAVILMSWTLLNQYA